MHLEAKYTSYETHIRKCFADAYRFFVAHRHAKTDQDWVAVVTDLSRQCTNEGILTDLFVAVFKEIEREYVRMEEGDTYSVK